MEEKMHPIKNAEKLDLKEVHRPVFLEKPSNHYSAGMNRKKIIAISSSGKGGTGKSTTSLMLALYFQKLNNNTVLIDFDIPVGDISTMLGMSMERSISDFFGIPDDLGEKYVRENLLLTHSTNLKVLPALRSLSDSRKVNQERFIEKLFFHLKSFDVIVVDTGPNFEPSTLKILDKATDIVYVTDDYETTFHNIYLGRNLLESYGIDVSKLKLVVNRANNMKESRYLHISNMTKIDSIYFLPFVKDMSAKVDKREYVIAKKSHVYSTRINELVKELAPEYFGEKEKKGLFSRIFGGKKA